MLSGEPASGEPRHMLSGETASGGPAAHELPNFRKNILLKKQRRSVCYTDLTNYKFDLSNL
jgi:hypothetical protein